jgi:hypothetical protein
MKKLITLFLFVVSVHLGWDASSGAVGYKIYYGKVTGVYTTVLNVGNVTNYVVPNVDETQPIFFAATAYDATANESVYSTELACAVISAKATGSGVVTTQQSDWTTSVSTPATVVEKSTGKDVTITAVPSTNYLFTALKIDGVWTSPVSSFAFSSVSSNHVVEAVFHKSKTLTGIEWVK